METEAEIKTKSRLESSRRMSNTGYHQNGKPTWWARLGKGPDAAFLEIPEIRGDYHLVCDVDVPPGTKLYIGAGKGHYKTIRETVETVEIPEEIAVEANENSTERDEMNDTAINIAIGVIAAEETALVQGKIAPGLSDEDRKRVCTKLGLIMSKLSEGRNKGYSTTYKGKHIYLSGIRYFTCGETFATVDAARDWIDERLSGGIG